MELLKYFKVSVAMIVALNAASVRANAQGRAQLQIEDLKTLLSMKARDPFSSLESSVDSSVAPSQQEVSEGAYNLARQLSPAEQHSLEKTVTRLEKRRTSDLAQIEKSINAKKEELRAQRKKLQVARLNAKTKAEGDIAKKLFDNLLAEANLDASKEELVAQAEEKYSVTVAFSELKGVRVVEAIQAERNQIWSANKSSLVAKQ